MKQILFAALIAVCAGCATKTAPEIATEIPYTDNELGLKALGFDPRSPGRMRKVTEGRAGWVRMESTGDDRGRTSGMLLLRDDRRTGPGETRGMMRTVGEAEDEAPVRGGPRAR